MCEQSIKKKKKKKKKRCVVACSRVSTGFLCVPTSRLGLASLNLHGKLHSRDAFEQATCADHRKKQIFDQIPKFVLDFKGQSADANESLSD